MDHRERCRALQAALAKAGLDVLVVTHLPNVRYLSGFTGSAGALLVTKGETIFFTDGRYTEQAKEEVQTAKIKIASRSPLALAAEWLLANPKKLGGKKIGIEGEHLTFLQYQSLRKLLGSAFKLQQSSGIVEQLRIVKDKEEIDRIREAVVLAASLFDTAIASIRPGVKETDVAADMEYEARRHGAEGMSFETIIASGARSALPHGRASAALIPPQGFVVCDFGVILAGYCSDMTRTVFVGTPTAEDRDVYEAVRIAQQASINAVKPGASADEVDRAGRNVLKKKGLGKYFTHSTGHGVGLEIHEAPRIAAGQKQVLLPGMVITIEPGAYIPGKGGVRIEDMVMVTERGCEILTPTPKDLITI
jgi:Xaa-Pro aminopeptidase